MTIKIYLLIIPIFILVGCSSPYISFDTEPLTGEKYCVVKANKLLPLSGCHHAELVLKSLPSEKAQYDQRVKAILKINHQGKRDYTINPHESLSIVIDHITYPLEILNSFKNPHETTETINTGTRSFRVAQEVTSRKISFYLLGEIVKKILSAKIVQLEITVPNSGKQLNSETYPIRVELEPKNIFVIQELQHKCINNISEENKNEKL